MVRFSLLGPVQARCGHAELDAGPRQQRAILALLLVRANQFVTVEDMIELLWGQQPPGSAVNIIHKYIGCIRRLLDPGRPARTSGRWLTRHGDAYRLAADETTSDLMAFRRIVKDGRSAQGQDRPGDALDLLLDALRLWRGTCGEDLWVRGHTRDYLAAVNQERAAATVSAADAALASAQPARVLAPVQQAAMTEPLNESLHARLMLVLAATGQQASALSHYQLVRKRLMEELGVDPGAEIRDAHSRVLRQEFPATARASASGGPSASPGPVPLVRPAQLPADGPAFAGRKPELAQLSDMLGRETRDLGTVGICVITGMAGVGKTALATHWAHRASGRFPDGQLYLNLRGFDPGDRALEPADALGALLASLGVPAADVPAGPDARAGLYRSLLTGKRLLIVLDNARDVEQVRPLLPAAPTCLVVVTSRNPLAGLTVAEGARRLSLQVPSRAAAREMLQRRLGRDRIAAEPEAAETVIELCGRLPLALAALSSRAAAHPEFTLASIVADVQRTPGHVEALAADAAAVGPRDVFSGSYERLSPEAARLFRLLRRPPAADITAATSAGLLGVSPEEATGLIVELVNVALLAEHRPGRFRLPDFIRPGAASPDEGERDRRPSG